MRARRPINDEFAQLIGETMLKIQLKMTTYLEKIVADKSLSLTKASYLTSFLNI